jgi:molybdopterin converting factor small subunit
VKVRYFAWVRERIGKAEEDIDPPDGIATVGDLVAWLTHQVRAMPMHSKIRTWSVARSISATYAPMPGLQARAKSRFSRR